ncbi:MAG: Rieske 2Fe-2S domain-containing protein, partial [Verrucomicrobiota bacterium]
MSVSYKAVGWTPFKIRYDLFLGIGVLLYLILFSAVTLILHPANQPIQVLIRAFGSAAIILLHIILAIGPLARLHTGFLPLLYNRRHLGVTLFVLGFLHAALSILWYHGFADINPFLSVFTSDAGWSVAEFPFQAFGFLALLILFVMAATSHDFWLANLTAPVWKTLHMGVYLAYGMLILHIAFGILQSETHSIYVILLGSSLFFLCSLHLIAAFREASHDRELSASPNEEDGFVRVCSVSDVPQDEAIGQVIGGEKIAIVRWENQISVVSGVCQHQNGPLAEGKFLHGCLTCPWHG